MRGSPGRSGPFYLVAMVFALMAAPLAAQSGTAGKIEGRVFDQASGQPLAGAQVTIVGTSLGNLTNADGYYFINNVPAGLRSIQAQYIGYQTVTVEDQRVLANQTVTVDFRLPTQAVALQAITVRGEANVLVPRDKTVSKGIVTGDVVNQLPIDNVNEVIALQPGVVQYGSQFVVRGGRPGEASVYIDGVLVRKFNSGTQQGNFNLGTNAVEEVNVLLGGFGAEYGSAQSGVVNYITKQGGSSYSGALRFGTDEILPNDARYGNSRLEASIGGPLIGNSSFHLAATFEGWEDANPRFQDDLMAADSIPVQSVFFRPVGLTNFLDEDGQPVLDGNGDPLQHMEYEPFSDLGNRRPYSNRDDYSISGTVFFNPFANTKVSAGAVVGRNQGLGFSQSRQFRPKMIAADISNTQMFRLGVEQILLQSAEQQAALRVNVAYSNDHSHSGQLADTVSLEPEGPDFLGFKTSSYELYFDEKFTLDKYLARLDSVKAGLAQNPLVPVETIDCPPGLTTCASGDFTPFWDASLGVDNPYGYTAYYVNSGLADYDLSAEKTLSFDVDLDFQANRTHRFGAGVELYKKEVDNMAVPDAVDTYFHNVYRVKPTIGAFWVKDRMDIGELVLDVGMRFDYFDSDAQYPELPGLVYPFAPTTEPGAQRDYELSLCATAPAAGEVNCNPNFIEQEPIWSASPRLGVAFPISDVTNFRLSYGHFFQIPAFSQLFSSINTDLRRSNTNTAFGRPIEAMKAVQFEVGLSHLFNPFTVLDITAYNKDKLADATYRIDLVNWPSALRGAQDARVLTNLDFGNSKGLDVRLTRRYEEYFTAIIGYSYLNTRGTSADPFSYINSFGRFVDPITGAPLSPAQALQSLDFDRTHQITIASTANFGADAAEDTRWNPLLRNTNVAMTLEAGSGLPYTRSRTASNLGRGASDARYIELVNSSRLPWSYTIDGRLTRGFELGDSKLAAFVDVRNLLNTRNTTNVYGFTSSAVDPGDIIQRVGGGFSDVTIADVDNVETRLSYQRQQDLAGMYGFADDDATVLTAQEQTYLRGLNYIHGSEFLPGNFSAPRTWRLGVEWVF